MPSPERTPDTFTAYVVARRPALLRTAYLLTGDLHDAEDLVQLALAKVVPRWGRIDGDPEPYVRRVLVHENISRWRRRRWREQSAEVLPEATAGPSRIDHEDVWLLRDALATLTPKQRAVVVLRYLDDLSEQQTADALGVSRGTVKSQTHAALVRLRERLPDLRPEGSAASPG
ncbi:RNA polymerase sigma-E factor [Nocardioides dokdonensis FR1436]|uniref:RNA polymerase sigma-E factor n=1 Tax=Nocardioides dokdonensis FR1436 TaxID=1300347 RepID=A0A1A9GQN6_9ACTN|nr:SigE family RNA polymerase sigma factor [Nocardioides dokdonensis]ANH39970.1 RNA polymerase sigma-E factor [Nocardioides dokdonensis FR1436]